MAVKFENLIQMFAYFWNDCFKVIDMNTLVDSYPLRAKRVGEFIEELWTVCGHQYYAMDYNYAQEW